MSLNVEPPFRLTKMATRRCLLENGEGDDARPARMSAALHYYFVPNGVRTRYQKKADMPWFRNLPAAWRRSTEARF